MDKIQTMIKEIPLLSDTQKKFFVMMLKYRYEYVLLPLYQKIEAKYKIQEEGKKGRCR